MTDATLDQHSKAQTTDRIQNGFDKDLVTEDFSAGYLHPASQQQGYGMPPSDPYIQSYYGQMAFPYMGEWSTAGESVPYLPGYNNIGNGEPPHSFMQDAMFGQPTGSIGNGGQAYFNTPVFQHGNEFTAWTSPPTGHSTGLDTSLGHQSATNNYNNDFYQTMMPQIQHDYMGRNDVIGSQSNIGGIVGHNAQSGIISSGMHGGDSMNKITGTPPLKVIEQGMHGLNMSSVGGDTDPMAGKAAVQHPGVTAGMGQVDNSKVLANSYGNSPVTSKIAQGSSAAQVPAKPVSWAAIASKPAKPQPKPKPKPMLGPGLPPPIKHNMDIGNWDNSKVPQRADAQGGNNSVQWNSPRGAGSSLFENGNDNSKFAENIPDKEDSEARNGNGPGGVAVSNPVLDKLKLQNEYNPKRLTIDLRNSRFFVIKSYSEDDIHRSIKYNIWCSTEHGNKRLDSTFRAQKNRGPVILLYSVNGSGHFCGVAEMKTCVDYSSRAGVWSQDKWKGKFQVKWIYVKDVPNTVLRHIRLENNDNKPVTNSRDTQEVPAEKGRQVLKIIANYKHQTSIFDDFGHYERRQQEEETQRNRAAQVTMNRERRTGDSLQGSNRKST